VREPKIDERDLEIWSRYLLDHSLGGVTPADRVMIKGERICWPLIRVLERGVIQAGGTPDVCIVPPNNERGRVWSAAMAEHGTSAQLERVPDWHRARYEAMTKYIEVLGAEEPALYSSLGPAQVRGLVTADRPFADIRLSRPWVLTLFPTPAFAAMEQMDLEEYVRFIVRASTTDPRPLKDAEDRLAPHLQRARRVRIETHHPAQRRDLQLTMELTHHRVVLSYGLCNFPDGEIFTSPDARTPHGEIFIDLPVNYGGNDIRGIYLKLEGGQIVDYSAEVGLPQLQAIIETDAGSHRLGELALGMNPGLDKVLKHPLFVEKVGGTLHIALGASYEHCFVDPADTEEARQLLNELEADGILNRSAQHVDIVADFRPGGCGRRVFLDDVELHSRDGLWVA
jgi:aminopeptidase